MNHGSVLRKRLSAAVTLLGASALTLALLAGIPYVLWWAVGTPWPELVSSWTEFADRLAQPVSDPLLIDLLAMVGWICWAAFTYTLIREAVWYATHLPQLVRDRRLHDEHLAGLSVKRSLAALCVGTLVLALLGVCRPQPVGDTHPYALAGTVRAHTTATATVTSFPNPSLSPAVIEPSTQAMVTTLRSAATARPLVAEEIEHVQYTVVDGDTLWGIAHTYLGDAFKWPRIYALNKDRVQRDGARLRDPDLIRPGWQLTIPVARPGTPPPSRTPVSTAPPPRAPVSPSDTARTQPSATPRTHVGEQAPGLQTSPQPGRSTEHQPENADARPGEAAISLGEAGLIGVTTAAGLLAARRYWYWHRNHRHDDDLDGQVPALSPLVDKAAQAAHAATRPHPKNPDPHIARRTPPKPPHSADSVTIGTRGNTEVTLHELAVSGGCTWTGPGAQDAARALLVGILTAAERQRPGQARVTAAVPQEIAQTLLPGLPPHFSALTQFAHTADAIRAAEQHLLRHAHAHDTLVPTPGSTQPEAPGTLVLLTASDAEHSGQLQALAARAKLGTLVVLTLDSPLSSAASWRIDTDGTTRSDTGHHDDLVLFHLTLDASRDVTNVLLTAHGQTPQPHRTVVAPQSLSTLPPGTATAPPTETTPAPSPPADTARPAQSKPVRLHVLGPITLYARGVPEPFGTSLRPEVHEFLALLAAHPAGLLAGDIADKMNLEQGNDQNALKNLRRAVRRALRAATGITSQEFILLRGELHKLNHNLMETDLADFSENLRSAFSSSLKGEARESLTAVRNALSHYSGPFVQGRDFLWADAVREQLASQAVDAVLRLAREAERSSVSPLDRDTVLALLEQLSDIHPERERLAQHAIRLYQAAGRHDAAQHAYNRLERHLANLGLQPEPATQALIAPWTHTRQKP